MNQDILNYCQWQNEQIYLLLEVIHINHINPNYGFELQTVVDANNQNEWQLWNGCRILDLPRIEGIAIDNDSRKVIIFFYNGDLLKRNRIEDGSNLYDYLLIDFKDIIGVRLEASARRVYEVTAGEGILPPISTHQYRNINQELYPHSISLLLATRRADAQIIRFDVSLNEKGTVDKTVSNTMNGIFSNHDNKISILSGTDKESYIISRQYKDANDIQLTQMMDIMHMLHSFALNVGAIIHDSIPKKHWQPTTVDEFMQKVKGWNYA